MYNMSLYNAKEEHGLLTLQVNIRICVVPTIKLALKITKKNIFLISILLYFIDPLGILYLTL